MDPSSDDDFAARRRAARAGCCPSWGVAEGLFLAGILDPAKAGPRNVYCTLPPGHEGGHQGTDRNPVFWDHDGDEVDEFDPRAPVDADRTIDMHGKPLTIEDIEAAISTLGKPV